MKGVKKKYQTVVCLGLPDKSILLHLELIFTTKTVPSTPIFGSIDYSKFLRKITQPNLTFKADF
jgi:hypothetical protein